MIFTWYHQFTDNTHLLIAPVLYNTSPSGVLMIEALTGLHVSPLTHASVKSLLQAGNNLIVFPGGYREISGFHDEEESMFLHTYGYWFHHVGRMFPAIKLCTMVVYGGATRWFRQSPRWSEARDTLARREIPALLPTGIRIPTDLDVIYYRLFLHDATTDDTLTVMNRVQAAYQQDHAVLRTFYVLGCSRTGKTR
jgi:hypothetical protein